ncbi:hypothetical protein PsorP6_003048 [Peronosclerospora sorghi]|uniref:Uncharacterized protein n=1 Tax=Peronosclerospora sorghi TaxID=230839 RepID=A0ACC0VJV0_9STRA|nr:hypothetical protein PsorP6_003048 [Peronosclerospora sorghi]
MRVGLAIQAFPSVVELYNDEQACVVSVLKMEEDEESVDGMPFVMREDGSDDALVCPSYYNEIQLRVCELQTVGGVGARACWTRKDVASASGFLCVFIGDLFDATTARGNKRCRDVSTLVDSWSCG